MGNQQPGADDPNAKPNTPPPGEEGNGGKQTPPIQDDPPAPKVDEAKWDEGTKKYIADLRKEAAAGRTKSKDLEGKFGQLQKQHETLSSTVKKALGIETDEKVTPEEQVKHFEHALQGSTVRLAILESALEHGLNRDQAEYYEFLMSKELSALKDDEELSDEAHAAVVTKAKGSLGGTQTAPRSSSVNPKGGTPPPDGKTETTPEEFAKMTSSQKGALYEKNPDLYTKLFQTAKDKKLL